MWFLLFADPAPATPPKLEIVPLAYQQPASRVCELELRHHSMDDGPSWSFRLLMSAPDAGGRSRIERVSVGVPDRSVPGQLPWHQTTELDLLQPFVHESVQADPPFAMFAPQIVDWSRWPLQIPFVGPGREDPTAKVAYRLQVDPKATRADWGSCILELHSDGGHGGCTMLHSVRGSCLADYEARHGLR